MKVKKYIAKTMIEAMKEVRSELGSEAVILSSKEVPHGGFLGMFKGKQIEVVATLDPDPIPEKNIDSKKAEPDSKAVTAPENKDEGENILHEIDQLKKMFERQRLTAVGGYASVYGDMLYYLTDQELLPSLAEEIVDVVTTYHEENNIKPSTELALRDTKREIEKRLIQVSMRHDVQHDQQVIHFVGPTGVGKTTTLAKVAAKNILKEHKKIAFITTDTYRIGAIEQLKTYAQILSVPVKVSYSLHDYKQALNDFSNYDMIFVDTAGRNFRDDDYVKELEEQIQVKMKVYLVLALTAKQKDILEIYEQFNHLPIKEIIFTKLDETNQYGSILNLALKHNLSVAYLTNGQDVPEDLLQPTPQLMTQYILGGYEDE